MKDSVKKPLICLLACFVILGTMFVIMETTDSAAAESYQWTDTGGGMDAFEIWSMVRGGSCLYALTKLEGIYRYNTAAASPSWTYIGKKGVGVFSLGWDGSHLYAGIGAGGVYRCDDPEAAAPVWTYIGPPGPDVTALGWDGSSLYSGTNGFDVYRCDDPAAATPSWANIGLGGLDIQALTWSGSYLYAGTSAGAYRYDPDAPSPAWTYIGMNAYYLQNLVWDGSHLYTGIGISGVYRCEDPEAATPTWTYIGPVDPPVSPTINSLAWDGSYLFAGSDDYGIYRCADPAAASPAWTPIGMGGFDVSSLAASDGFGLYAGTNSQGIWQATPIYTWYLAEGATAEGFDTWILVQNPNNFDVPVDLTFMTENGPLSPPELQGVNVPANSRMTFDPEEFAQTYDLSTVVKAYGGDVVCERAMYDTGLAWGTDSIGTKTPSPVWYLAEGSTDGGMETFIPVLNPNPEAVYVSLDFMTSSGQVAGPQDFRIPPGTRITFDAGEYVTDYDVSTVVTSEGGDVICERSMYGGDRTWGHNSIGAAAPAATWYLAEGCTAPGFETWVLVQNPGADPVTVDLTLMTESGSQLPLALRDVVIPAYSRRSFNLGEYVQCYDLSTQVVSEGGGVICERAMYGEERTWGTDSIGATVPAYLWYLAEGCTGEGFETWVLVQNPGASPVAVDLTFMTSDGPQDGPQDVVIPAYSRRTFNVAEYVVDWNVSTRVFSVGGGVVCERAMYGNGRTWAHDSIGYTP